MFYVYRFLNNKNKVIYIGKTNNIERRIKQHFSNSGHLTQKAYNQTTKIEYIKCATDADMTIKEIYYINKWKPIYNTADKKSDKITISSIIEKTDKWLEYNRKESSILQKNNEWSIRLAGIVFLVLGFLLLMYVANTNPIVIEQIAKVKGYRQIFFAIIFFLCGAYMIDGRL